METLKHSIKIYRGEEFTINKRLVNKDGSPYIVSSSLENPHFLISISDKPYSQNGRIVKNYWLPVSQTFELNKPVNASTVKNFKDFSFSGEDNSQDMYIGDDIYSIYPDTAVFYVDLQEDDDYGKYVKWDETTNTWTEYNLSVTYAFSTDDTSKLKPNTYYYTIQLVTGELLRPYLEKLADEYGVEYTSSVPAISDFSSENYTDNFTLMQSIVNAGHTFPENFSENQAIGFITSSLDILPPNELKVTNYMQGGIL